MSNLITLPDNQNHWLSLFGAQAWLILLLVGFIGVISSPARAGLWEIREYRAAVGLLRNGELELARSQYNSFLENYPRSDRRGKAYFGLAETYYLQDKFDSAGEYYYRGLQHNLPDNYKTQAFTRGLESVHRAGRPGLAKKILELSGKKFADQAPDSGLRHALQLFEAEKRYGEALKLIDRVLERRPEASFWLYQKAVVCSRSDSYQAANKYLGQLVEKEDEYGTRARFMRAEIALTRGQLAQARSDYQRLRGAEELKYDALYGLAWIRIKKQNKAAARKLLRKVAGEAPPAKMSLRILAARDLARVYRKMKSVDKAEQWYDTAINLASEPRRSKLCIEFAEYKVEQDKLREAVPYYELARALPLTSKKSLIEGYISRREYKSAANLLEKNLNNNNLNSPRWRRLLAFCYFKLQRLNRALETIPVLKSITERQEKIATMRLRGSIYYRLGELAEARRIFKHWQEKFRGPEPRLNLALVADKQGKKQQARQKLQGLLDGTLSAELKNRVSFHLARMYFEEERARARKYLEQVNPVHLSTDLAVEYKILRLTDRLRRKGPTPRLLTSAQELKKQLKRDVYYSRFYGRLTTSKVPRQWWNSILLPLLKTNQRVRRDWGATTVNRLRRRGWLKLALKTGKQLLVHDYSPGVFQKIKLAHLKTLLQLKKYAELKKSLPSVKKWANWKPANVRPLVLVVARYYREISEPEQGLKSLRKLLKTVPRLRRADSDLIRETMAAFELSLGKIDAARRRLLEVGRDRLSLTGRLNLAITAVHRGQEKETLGKLLSLRQEWDSPPVQLYRYGFKLFRSLDKQQLQDTWSRDFLQTERFSDTDKFNLLVKNIKYWVNEGGETIALGYIGKLSKIFSAHEFLIELGYYRALAFYNRGALEQARQAFNRLRKTYELSDKWLYRCLRTEVELALRLQDWSRAYQHWRELHKLGRGGEAGSRILQGRGVEKYPEKFEKLLAVMEKNYSTYLPRGDTIYWQGRIREKRGSDTQAREKYKEYLAGDYEQKKVPVRRRLARIYEKNSAYQKALDQWKKIHEQTENSSALVRQGVLHRKLKHFRRSISLFQRVLKNGEFGRKQWLNFQIGQNLVRAGEDTAGFDRLTGAIETAPETASWTKKARLKGISLALNNNRSQIAARLLTELGIGPRSVLYRAELNRQQGDTGAALSHLEKFRADYFPPKNNALQDDYRQIAENIYWQTESYQKLVELLPEVPATSRLQFHRLKALVELDKIEAANFLYQQLNQPVVPRAASELGNYYFHQQKWRLARGYYREARPNPRIAFRLSKIQLKLDRPRQALQALHNCIRLLPRGDTVVKRWSGRLLGRLEKIVGSGNQLRLSSARLIDNNWVLFSDVDTRAVSLGLRWSMDINDTPLVFRYIKRLPAQFSTSLFSRTANWLKNRQRWEKLAELTAKFETEGGTAPLILSYYRLVGKARDNTDTALVSRVNKVLNRAIEQNSQYGPRLQKLIGDIYFNRENFQKAAVEYHKVKMLFSANETIPRAKFMLGRCYVKLDKPEKARQIFTELQEDNTLAENLRQKSEKWLEEL